MPGKHQPRANLDEYLVCSRNASPALVSFSILASCIGGSATIGMAGLAWQCGTPAFWWLGVGVIGLLILGLFAARKIRHTDAYTLPQIIQSHLGTPCAFLTALLVLLASLAIIAAQFSATGILLASLTGMAQTPALLLGSAILLAYTFIGGQRAVMKSDVWQFAILAGSLLLAFILLIQNPACRQAVLATPLEAINAAFPPDRFRYFLIILGGSFVIGPMLSSRILSATSGQSARSGTLWAAFGLALIATLITALGIALQGLPLGNIAPQNALSSGIALALPACAATTVTLGLFSAVISSADSCLLTAAAVAANDLGKSGSILRTRVWLVLITAGSCLLAMYGKGIIALLLAANDIYVAGVVAPVFVAIIKGPQADTQRKIFLLAMLCGGCLGLVGAITGNSTWSMLGFVTSATISLLAILPLARFARAAKTPADS